MTHRTLMAGDDLYPARGDRRRRRRRQRGGRSAVAVVLALVVVLAVIGGVVYVGSRLVGGFLGMNADYPGAGTTPVRVEIKEGQSTRSIAGTLHDAGVIRTTGAFVNAARGNPRAATIQPGFYKLKKEMKASIALAALLDDKNRVNKPVTVPEGLRLTDTLKILAKRSGLPLKDFQAAVKKPSALGLPDFANGRPEGFLFPATYDVTPGTTAQDLLQQMVGSFTSMAGDVDLPNRAHGVRLTPSEVIVMASLVEDEGGRQEDFPKVARVLFNRLHKGMRLELDSTVTYGLGIHRLTTTAAERAKDTPYNTYLHAGLPIGPISSPGREAIEAVLAPADGNWLFFVTVNPETKETKFASTFEEHQKNVQEFQEWLRNH